MQNPAVANAMAHGETNVPQLGGALIRVLVLLLDLDNIAWRRTTATGKPMLENILSVFAKLEQAGVNFLGVAGPALWRKIDDSQGFKKMLAENSRRVAQSPPGAPADVYILAYAKELAGQGKKPHIMTNDKFEDHPGGSDYPFVRFMIMPDGHMLMRPDLADLLGKGESSPVEAPPSCEGEATGGLHTGPAPTEELGEDHQVVDPSLLESVARLLARAKPLQDLLRTGVNFATVAAGLHALYGGDFTKTFGYRRPKDLAEALARMGLATISLRNGTMYLTPTERMEPLLSPLAGLGEQL